MVNARLCLFVLLSGLLFLSLSVQARPVQRFVFQEQVRGFSFRLELYSTSAEQAEQLARQTWQAMQTASASLTPVALAQLVRQALQRPAPLSEAQATLLGALLRYHRLSQGALDPTAAPLYALWGFDAQALSYHLPTEAEIQAARTRLNAAAVQIYELPPRLQVSREGLTLLSEPGLQGFLVDQGVPVLRKAGLPAALTTTQAGYYLGMPPDAKAWKVAVPHPNEKGKIFSYLYVKDEALAQVSVSDNAFSHGGLSYHALLDARTGRPTSEALAVSVTRPSALEAQLSAHLLARLPDEACRRLLPELPGLHALKLLLRNGFLSMLEYPS